MECEIASDIIWERVLTAHRIRGLARCVIIQGVIEVVDCSSQFKVISANQDA